MRSRSIWAAAIMDDGSCAKITLGVQTLRNGLMTSTFFCSTAFGLLTLAV